MIKDDGVIIGAGIAGLATAIFGQEQGLRLSVYERAHDLPGDEHLLWIAPNGLHVLDRLGVLGTVLAQSVSQAGMDFADKGLGRLMGLSGSFLRKKCGYPIVAIKRRDLWHAIYAKFLATGGEIHWGTELAAISENPMTVDLSFTGSAANISAPFVIGADGMGSKVRAYMAPDSFLHYQGIRTWLGCSLSPVAKNYVGNTIELWGVGTRFVLTSLDGETVYWSALERAAAYESQTAPISPSTPARLQALFAEYHPDIQEILAAPLSKPLLRCNFSVVKGLRSFHSQRLVLIGDAAHGMPPNMGQGASLGLEDAAWLSYFLAQNPTTLPSAFRAFQQKRKPRIQQMRSIANSMNGLFQPESRLAALLRDQCARLVPDALSELRMGQLYQPSLPGDRS